MKNKKIGILGATGNIGSCVRKTLEPNFFLKLGSRDEKKFEKENATWTKVDVFNDESLKEFCSDCDVIVNCAGPSYLMSERIAEEVNKKKTLYIDVFGGNIKTSHIYKEKLNNIKAVVGVGVYPGLTGILPMYMAEDFEKLYNMWGYCGGLEEVSYGAGIDFILSAISGFGSINTFIKDGKKKFIKKSLQKYERVLLPNVPEEAILQPFLSEEILSLSEKLKLENVHWHNAIFNEGIQEEIIKGCNELLIEFNEINIKKIGNKLCESTKKEIDRREPFYTIGIEMEGRNNHRSLKKRAVLKCSNSSYLTSQITALCVRQLLEKEIKEGIYWSYECVNVEEIINELKQCSFIECFEIDEISKELNLWNSTEGVI